MNKRDKKLIYEAFLNQEISVQSVTKDKKIEWKSMTDIMKHDVKDKIQYKINLENNVSCIVTEDHSLFLDEGDVIKSIKTKEFKTGDDLIFIENKKVISKKVLTNLRVPSVKFMFDLSVQDNENFVLESGILAHNSFRPPASEKFIQGQTQVFGFIWEDEELLEYLYMAVDDFNGRPPTTGIEFFNLWGTERRWRTTIIMRAAAFACFAIAMNWIQDEFSVDGKEMITVKDSEGNDYSVTMEELYDIIYGDILKEMKRRAKEECATALKEIENEFN